jgi:hypothetical protein
MEMAYGRGRDGPEEWRRWLGGEVEIALDVGQ